MAQDITSEQLKTKRIAYNTVILFVRMFVIACINLYTIRWILKSLGVEDYGIFNAVAGIVLLGTSFSSVLSQATQRFFSYALGQKDHEQVKQIFSVSINCVVLFSVLVFLLLEVVGPYFIATHMTIPPTRLDAALWVFHLSILSFIFSCLQIPFIGMVYAQEDMWIYALLSMIDCILKLLLAIFVTHIGYDNLVMYGLGLALIALCTFILYALFSLSRYNTCKYHWVKNKKQYLSFLSFSGWTLFSAMAGVSIIQGSAILLNMFFSPIINAAFAIGNQLYNAFNMLVNAVFIAFRPAMIKSYAEQNHTYLDKIFTLSNKAIFYLMLCVTIPFILEMQTILSLWLGKENINHYTLLFSQLMLVYTLFLSLNNPITAIIHATGHIKQYSLWVETTMLLCLPLSWVAFRLSMPSQTMLYIFIVLTLIAHLLRIWVLKRQYPLFSVSTYLLRFLLPAMLIALLVVLITAYLHYAMQPTWLRLGVISLCSLCTIAVLVYLIGLSAAEKAYLRQNILKVKTQ